MMFSHERNFKRSVRPQSSRHPALGVLIYRQATARSAEKNSMLPGSQLLKAAARLLIRFVVPAAVLALVAALRPVRDAGVDIGPSERSVGGIDEGSRIRA